MVCHKEGWFYEKNMGQNTRFIFDVSGMLGFYFSFSASSGTGCQKKEFIIKNGVLKDYKGTKKKVVIPEGVKKIGNKAFQLNYHIQKVVLPDSVVIIEDDAFNSCRKLKSITISDSVTKIGNSAFYDCSRLKSITIPDSVTKIGDDAFCGCEKLQNIELSDNLKKINYSTFYACYALQSIKLPDNLKTIDSFAFYECGLKSIVIPDSVTHILNEAFSGCHDLEKVVLLDNGEHNLFQLGARAFQNCSKLSSLVIPYGEIGGDGEPFPMQIGEDTFAGCTNLVLEVPSYMESFINDDAGYSDCKNVIFY